MAIYFAKLILFLLIFGYGIVQLEASHQVYIHLQDFRPNTTDTVQPYRTSYHFQPPQNWINDPNGPMVYKGIYHLFYQYNPKGAVWGNIVWAHSTSTDLVNWTPQPHAIFPSTPSDIEGCWSGSATIFSDGKPVILYTGIAPHKRQVQDLAFPKDPNDPYLKEWIKSDLNPIMAPTEENRINASSFRDPTTAWQGPDGRWRVLVGGERKRRGLAILYRSKDFRYWVLAKHPLHSSNGDGMWECPDFFPVAVNGGKEGIDTSVVGPHVKHVLKKSLDDTKHDVYTIGTYNFTSDRYFPDSGMIESDAGLRYDYGKYYASKTFYDSSKNRRILLGWANESSTPEDDVKKGWAGIQLIPRTIWLEKSGKQLLQWPVPEIETLRTNPVTWPSKPLKGGSDAEIQGVTATQADVEISFKITGLEKAEAFDPNWKNPQLLCSQKDASVKGDLGPFGLLVMASQDMKEQTAVFFRIFKEQNNKHVVLMCSDQSKSSLNLANDRTTYGAFLNVNPAEEQLSLRTLIDRSVVESFGGGGKVCITSRVYPKVASDGGARLFAFNHGTLDVEISQMNAWSMKKANVA